MNRFHSAVLAGCLVFAMGGCAGASDLSDASPPGSTSPSRDAPSAAPSSSEPMASHAMGSMAVPTETVTVDIVNFAFEPSTLTIRPGTEVIFTNSDAAPHTVTAGTDAEPMPDAFDSGLLQPGDTFTFVFEEAGTFAYFCERHPPMTGSIVVEG